jgi:hypothetical protein
MTKMLALRVGLPRGPATVNPRRELALSTRLKEPRPELPMAGARPGRASRCPGESSLRFRCGCSPNALPQGAQAKAQPRGGCSPQCTPRSPARARAGAPGPANPMALIPGRTPGALAPAEPRRTLAPLLPQEAPAQPTPSRMLAPLLPQGRPGSSQPVSGASPHSGLRGASSPIGTRWPGPETVPGEVLRRMPA